MKIRDSILSDFKNIHDPNLKAFTFSSYKFYRNRIVTLLRLSKRLYYNNYFTVNYRNLKKIWSGIREIISTPKARTRTEIQLQIDDELTSDPQKVASKFNEFFSSVANKIRSKIPFSQHHRHQSGYKILIINPFS